MLQQTQVTTVLPYYQRFTRALPTVKALAHAPLQRVLKLWEGLGYYARARNLHRAAQQVVKQWRGKFPADPDLLQTLPGVGRSTAGAIVSLAFGKRSPILDGNLRRVFARFLAIETPLNSPPVLQQLWSFSAQILPRDHVADFNQALMDLGATICTPKRPSCLLCPVCDLCQAYRIGIQDRIPISPRRKALPHRRVSIAIILRGNQILITKRAEQGLLGGLWGLPEVPITKHNSPQEAKQALLDLWGVEVKIAQTLKPLDHTFSHFKMTYYPLIGHYISGTPKARSICRWVSPQNLPGFPFSAATLRIFRMWKSTQHPYSESFASSPDKNLRPGPFIEPASLAAEESHDLTPVLLK
jgi:A/G-specific adenine glycosylase